MKTREKKEKRKIQLLALLFTKTYNNPKLIAYNWDRLAHFFFAEKHQASNNGRPTKEISAKNQLDFLLGFFFSWSHKERHIQQSIEFYCICAVIWLSSMCFFSDTRNAPFHFLHICRLLQPEHNGSLGMCVYISVCISLVFLCVS